MQQQLCWRSVFETSESESTWFSEDLRPLMLSGVISCCIFHIWAHYNSDLAQGYNVQSNLHKSAAWRRTLWAVPSHSTASPSSSNTSPLLPVKPTAPSDGLGPTDFPDASNTPIVCCYLSATASDGIGGWEWWDGGDRRGIMSVEERHVYRLIKLRCRMLPYQWVMSCIAWIIV